MASLRRCYRCAPTFMVVLLAFLVSSSSSSRELLASSPTDTGSSSSSSSKKSEPLKIAFCLTGQLARLELWSKIANIFVPNVKAGHTVHLFVLLDNEVEQVKQTFWRYDYSEAPFTNFDEKKMMAYFQKRTEKANLGDKFVYRIRLEPPSQGTFPIVGGFIPVEDKVMANQHVSKDGAGKNEKGMEPAADRFQNNLRWMAGLRECVKWMQVGGHVVSRVVPPSAWIPCHSCSSPLLLLCMQAAEQEQGFFYDLVVRLRDDTFAFADWVFDSNEMKNALTSADLGSYRGINDHNLVLDRKWSDVLFRGLTEDYYFNKTNRRVMWGNPEHRIYQVATAYRVNIRTATMCKQPLIPLRANQNSTHWLLHPAYTDKMKDACVEGFEEAKGCRCPRSWMDLFHVGFYPINEPPPQLNLKAGGSSRDRRSSKNRDRRRLRRT